MPVFILAASRAVHVGGIAAEQYAPGPKRGDDFVLDVKA
jgi:hypothetical protein